MKFATIAHERGTRAAIIGSDHVDLLPFDDVGAALASGWDPADANAHGGVVERVGREAITLTQPVLRPDKVFCVGLNFAGHAAEANLPIPQYPVLFAKYRASIIGPTDDIVLPVVSDMVDWEAELVFVVGPGGRYIPEAEALAHIAGYTVGNDISMRDWQVRTSQFLQGKTFEASSPFGPWFVTPDEVDHARDLPLGCDVNGIERQRSTTADMIFSPAQIVSYLSQFISLSPGDLVFCGTPGGIGAAADPPTFLADGDEVRTWVDGIGEIRNRCAAERLEVGAAAPAAASGPD